MQKRLMRSQFFFSMSNSFRNMTIIKLVKLFQKPLQAFQFRVKNENRGTVDMRILVLRNYLQELRMISPHVPANWPCTNLNRNGGVVRKVLGVPKWTWAWWDVKNQKGLAMTLSSLLQTCPCDHVKRQPVEFKLERPKSVQHSLKSETS